MKCLLSCGQRVREGSDLSPGSTGGAVLFYESRLDGLGLRFLAAVEKTTERISTRSEAGVPLVGEFRKRIVPGFPYNIIYRVWSDYVYLVAVATNIVALVIAGSGSTIANHQLEKSLRSH